MPDRQSRDLTPQEEKAAQLRASGLSKAEAVRQAFNCTKLSQQRIWEKSCRLFGRPQVQARVRELSRATETSVILSKQEYLVGLLDDYESAKLAGNWTAAASFKRLVGQTIQALSDRLEVDDVRDADSAVIERVRTVNPEAAALLEKTLAGKDDFKTTTH